MVCSIFLPYYWILLYMKYVYSLETEYVKVDCGDDDDDDDSDIIPPSPPPPKNKKTQYFGKSNYLV